MEQLNFINGATVSATDVRKSWAKIVKGVKESKQPVFVFTNNVPEAVVLDFKAYQTMAQQLEDQAREKLGEQLSQTYRQFVKEEALTVPEMRVAEDGAFYKTKKAGQEA